MSRPFRRGPCRLDAPRLLDQFFDGASDGKRKAGLISEVRGDLHVLERPSEGDTVPFLERIRGTRAYQQRRTQFDEIDSGGLRQPARFDQANGIDPKQEV